MNQPDDAEELLDAYLDGRLPADRLPELEQALQQDARLCRRFWSEQRLRYFLGLELGDAEPSGLPARRSHRGAWVALSCAALLLLGGGLWLWRPWSAPVPLPPATTTFSNSDPSPRTISCPDGSRLVLDPASAIQGQSADQGLAYRLLRGGVTAEVVDRDGRGPFIVTGDLLQAEVVGTRFHLFTDPDVTLLRVLEGTVRWRRHDTGETGTIGTDQEQLVFSPTAVARLPDMAAGLPPINPQTAAWQRIDLQEDDTWYWRAQPRAATSELIISSPQPRASGCFLAAYRKNSSAARMQVWGAYLAKMQPLPAAAEPLPFDELWTTARQALAIEQPEEWQPVFLACRFVGSRHFKDWYELQVHSGDDETRRYLVLGEFLGMRLWSDRRDGLLPDLAAWHPFPGQPTAGAAP